MTETICFHCQQAVEKYLKSYLIYLGIPFRKPHEIGELITQCESKDSEITQLKEDADTLTDYAVNLRYPDDLYVPSDDEAKEAYGIAKKVRNYILSKMPEISIASPV